MLAFYNDKFSLVAQYKFRPTKNVCNVKTDVNKDGRNRFKNGALFLGKSQPNPWDVPTDATQLKLTFKKVKVRIGVRAYGMDVPTTPDSVKLAFIYLFTCSCDSFAYPSPTSK